MRVRILTAVATALVVGVAVPVVGLASPAAAVSGATLVSVGPGTTDGSLLVTWTGSTTSLAIGPASLGFTNCVHRDWDTVTGGPGTGTGYIEVDTAARSAEFSTMFEWWSGPDIVLQPGTEYIVCGDAGPMGGTPMWGYTAGAITVTDEDNAPQPVLQQVGLMPGGTCENMPADLDWGGVEPGGWTQSWAEWAHDGMGGAVCSRLLKYSVSAGHWVAAA